MTPAEAWDAVVAGEDAALYAYSVAGARVPSRDRRAALTAADAHRSHRDRAAEFVAAAGGVAPAPEAAYALPADVGSPDGARATLADVENALVAVYADAAAAVTAGERRFAARIAAECAVRAVTWGAAPQAFPTSAQ